ncbi:MAG: DEAD/DEAH box helicase, partial [Verrucomicrobia bacterium]|nr:DEAD/DEAH box helicase [Verrucomicrobiota bacterium]
MSQPVTAVWGVGGERARLLARLAIHTVGDLLFHKPRRYEDRRRFLSIRELQLGEPATVRGKIIAAGVKSWRKGMRAMFECVLDDGSGHLYLRWWQSQPWMEDYYATGREFLAFGKAESLRPRTFDHPETELLESGEDEFIHVNRIVPIHPLTEGLTARAMRTIVWRALEMTSGAGCQVSGGKKPDSPHIAPDTVILLRDIHFPDEMGDVENARRQLALGEFIELQKQIQLRRKIFESKSKAIPCGGDNNRLIKPYLSQLGFKLTGAQTRVLREIRADMNGEHPMRRLLQGDVGSGKTAVAACAALMAAESGFNVALMAPTEILADQHFRNFQRWFEPLGINVEIQTGSRKTSGDVVRGAWCVNAEGASLAIHASRTTHHASIFIGTHALLTSGFNIPRLGLVIIDEQHKFGVSQREELVRKGNYPHLLVMTATPIPRTLGLTLYGDLDLSTIDELPAGRGKIKTFVRASDKLPKVWEFIRGKLKAGRQAYVVYPRVEEQDTANNIKAV